MSDEIMRPIYGMQQDHRANRSAAEEIDAIDQVANHIEAQAARIAELEAVLRGIIDYVEDSGRDYCEWYHDTKEMARAALEGGEDE